MLLVSVYLIILFPLIVVSFSPSVFLFRCVASVALALVFMPGLYSTAYRASFPAFFMRLPLVCLYCLCVFLFVFYIFIFYILSRRCPLLATFLSVLFCLLSLLIFDSRFDLVWFRLSCDHGWIRSGSVNARKTTNNNSVKGILYRVVYCFSMISNSCTS